VKLPEPVISSNPAHDPALASIVDTGGEREPRKRFPRYVGPTSETVRANSLRFGDCRAAYPIHVADLLAVLVGFVAVGSVLHGFNSLKACGITCQQRRRLPPYVYKIGNDSGRMEKLEASMTYQQA
jgi:hypothetical protein